MIFQGKAITVDVGGDHIARLVFNLQGESVNKFNQLTLRELQEATAKLRSAAGVKGLIVSSAKDMFIVGADITEFKENFSYPAEELQKSLYAINEIFNAVEDLPFPTVTAINGTALGGGLEMCLTTDYRVIASGAKIGFPEVQLGIIPGYGGTVRTPRLIGADNAVEWVCTGKQYRAEEALAVGMVDAVVAPEKLQEAALDLLKRTIAGEFDYQKRRKEKTAPLKHDDIELLMAFTTGKAVVAAQSPKGMVAPITAAKTMEKAAKLGRNDALKVEGEAITKLAKGDVAPNLIGIFLNDQALIKKAKGLTKSASELKQAAVLGAGIMGGGIAYQSATSGVAIVMKDINQAGIDMGLKEAAKLLSKRVERGRLSPQDMAVTLSRITPTLSYEGFDKVDCVVEAVVENPKVKKIVLAEVESKVAADTIIASNTSTIPISELATALQRPENFCGMHFFNPVHQMPLVEIIRGQKTSDAAVAKTVAYALAMGKKPVVVNDCPGFLVNRILFGYFAGFALLLKDGADFNAVDKAAEKFGWPMGPAYLIDVVGIDTAVHAGAVMAEGFPDRMKQNFKTAMEVLLEAKRLGQKNGLGFYKYEIDKKGKPKKVADEAVTALLAPHVGAPRSFTDEEIMDRLMVPFCLEAVRSLEDGIAASATEIDLALIYGVGFPPFRGGALRYVEQQGIATFVSKADALAALGGIYQPTTKLKAMAAAGETSFA